MALEQDDGVLELAYLNSHFQTGLKNLMDRAVLAHEHAACAGYAKADEVPFDFARRMMSVVVDTPAGRDRLICKGAPEAVYAHCTHYELGGEAGPSHLDCLAWRSIGRLAIVREPPRVSAWPAAR